MSKVEPIGIFDSGSGGLSIWQSVTSLLPHESTIYIGDHAHTPYGNKKPSFIRARAKKLIGFLIKHGAKLIVVACNAATVAGIDSYRDAFPGTPIIGVVPVVKTAAAQTKSKHVLVLSTGFTAKSAYQKKLIATHARDCTVYSVGSTSLVTLIEKGETRGPAIDKELRGVLGRYLNKNIDVIALGCTHFPFVAESVRAIVKESVAVIDSGGAVVRHTERILKRNNIEAKRGKAQYQFFTTGDQTTVQKVFLTLIGKEISVNHVTL